MRNVVGIDLGTTFSCVATFQDGKVEIIPNEEGRLTTPSVVAFTEQGRLVGDSAKSQMGTNPKNTIYDAKRLIGRKFSDKKLQEDIDKWPFKVVSDEDDNPKIEVEYKGEVEQFRPEQILAMILEKMKKIAEDYTGKPVNEAVITVPAYFNNAQRQATKNAAELAQLTVMRIFNEPTAAAIAYGFQTKIQDKKNILVFDLGGGTFDVTLLKIEDGIYEVLATCGDTHLGGEDFSNRMVVYCCKDILSRYKTDIINNTNVTTRLGQACEEAKRTLATAPEASIDIKSLLNGIDYYVKFTREQFESLNQTLFEKLMEPVDRALKDAKLSPENLNDILLVGGSTRISKIHKLIQEKFPHCKINKDIHPDEAVAYGAAIQSAKLEGEEECEALQEMVLLDVTSLSLGLETIGGMMSVIIPRNTTVPVTKTKVYTTYKDNQSSVQVKVYEGERQFTKDNNTLGDFRLCGLRQAKAKELQIKVDFNVDSNGILTVSANQVGGDKKEKTVEIKDSLKTLSEEEIQNMLKRAADFRLDDDIERQRVQARIQLETLCLRYQSEFRRIAAKKIAGSERESVFLKVATVLSWIEANAMKAKEEYEALYTEVHEFCEPIRQKIYEPTRCTEGDEKTDYETVD